MKLGELPNGMSRTTVPLIDGRAHVRFYCHACTWTTAFMSTPETAMQITPEHRCPEAELKRAREWRAREWEVARAISPECTLRERQVNEQEFGFAGVKFPLREFPSGGTPEVM